MHVTAEQQQQLVQQQPPRVDDGRAPAAPCGDWSLTPLPQQSRPTTPVTVLSSSSLASSAASSPRPTTALGLSAPSKRLNWTRRLVITRQPLSEFYKDEGGKANALEVEVTLVEFDQFGEPARSSDKEFVDIPLRILLFFESGKRVDDTDQEIFRFVGNDYDSVVIRAATRTAVVQFRLEKVSRRKDGQRFKLRIEVDQEQCTANVADLTPVFTNAICVLSKRKHPSPYSSDSSIRVKEPPPKLLKRDLALLEDRLNRKIDGLSAQVHHLGQLVQKQNELLAKRHTPSIPPGLHSAPSESAILEWLLRSNTVDDSTWSKPALEPHLLPNTIMPYFELGDEPYHGVDVDLTPALVALPATTAAATTTTTTKSDTHTSEPTTPSLPFGDL